MGRFAALSRYIVERSPHRRLQPNAGPMTADPDAAARRRSFAVGSLLCFHTAEHTAPNQNRGRTSSLDCGHATWRTRVRVKLDRLRLQRIPQPHRATATRLFRPDNHSTNHRFSPAIQGRKTIRSRRCASPSRRLASSSAVRYRSFVRFPSGNGIDAAQQRLRFKPARRLNHLGRSLTLNLNDVSHSVRVRHYGPMPAQPPPVASRNRYPDPISANPCADAPNRALPIGSCSP
jgi:hypothetical protein